MGLRLAAAADELVELVYCGRDPLRRPQRRCVVETIDLVEAFGRRAVAEAVDAARGERVADLTESQLVERERVVSADDVERLSRTLRSAEAATRVVGIAEGEHLAAGRIRCVV